ncbi:MAG TPA: metallophosphoesterase family protein, partial [Xanthobacteraceae bacterium]|nr:metallophosphoesterase family protein [Xanthobacteraceae bacterium]
AALYDIHGNLPALEAVLADVEAAGVDHIVIGGDVVPGPMPRETLTRLVDLDRPVSFIQGNGEVAVFAERVGTYFEPLPDHARTIVRWTAHAVGATEGALMASWPMLLTLDIEGIGPVLFCHGTPRHHNEIVLATTRESRLRPLFDPLRVPLVVCGHTHIAFDRRVGATRLVNAGSVGLPFGEAGADWLLLGPGVQPRRTSYDLNEAAARVRASEYIDRDTFAAQLLQPPSVAAIHEAFAPAELRYGR